MHIFRVSPEAREHVYCEEMPNPFICDFVAEQPNIEGRKFFVHGTDANGNLANVPSSFSAPLDTAVPGEGVHAWDVEGAVDVSVWDNPVLIEGLYDGMMIYCIISFEQKGENLNSYLVFRRSL